ncbi:Gamma-interferon-inducible lysosomal thiol reductase [Orchesella cincta]|uniref:Gamma-interferon-inducible lysosomal thiol reductase n=1 Tax=Orchesella cincta TaxID=48709 RepID=A0A1D2MCR4_ORCCI|nr:Gamma-interferon-inducible lysosomal thiol reductase [Orchesella cincta]
MTSQLRFWSFSVAMSVLALLQVGEGVAHVKVELYYESLCPYCAAFIVEQLVPLHNLFGGVDNKYFEVELIPFGKAKVMFNTEVEEGNFNLTCHHGAPECEGNKAHTCALQKYSKKDAIDFVNCSMALSSWNDFTWPLPEPFISKDPTCITNLGLNQLVMDECVSSPKSNVMIARHGIRTLDLDPPLYYVPWIVIDGQWISKQFRLAKKDLKSIVCNKLKQGGVESGVCKVMML